jgi:Ca-activated chloride channel family protein
MNTASRPILTVILAVGTGACFASEDSGGYVGDEYGGDDSNGDGASMPVPPGEPEPEDPEDPDKAAEPEPTECDATEEVTLYLSPDDSNSMSSAVQAREAVLDGFGSLSSVSIRPWEFMNYYVFDYPAAEAGGVRVVSSMMVPAGAGEGEYTLQIAVTSEHIAPEERAPLNITLVLDTSGSMEGHPMDMLVATCRAIAGSLNEGDILSMVTWDTQNQEILGGHVVHGPNDPALLAAIDTLEAGGGTDLHAGLTAGYALAQEHYDKSRINRVVLVSDGGANVGVTDIDLIAARAEGNDSEGIYMVGVGVGSSETYQDDLMDAVTDAGKGASVFINDAAEAQRIFGYRFISTLDVAARDVSVQLDMPPGFSVVRFSGEEISTDPEEVEPQHLAPNDTMVFHQQIETCAPELVQDDTTITVSVRYEDATTFQSQELRTEVSFAELLQVEDRLLLKGAAVFAYAEVLKAWSGGSAEGKEEAFAALERAQAAAPEDPDLAEIREVLEAL